jgi:hypothetical protein
MTFSRSARRLLAAIAAASLLLCQTAMAAQTCVFTPATAPETASSGHCHGVGPQSGNESGRAQEQGCPSAYASAGFAKLDVPQAGELPALLIEPLRLRTPARAALSAGAPPARAEPPPLIIVNCCLRN